MDTPSGIKAGAQTTNYYRGPRFRNRPYNPDQEGCVPDEVILCDDTDRSMYCHLLCALAQSPEVVKVYATFAGWFDIHVQWNFSSCE
jgi:auxin responsive GH3 family protein